MMKLTKGNARTTSDVPLTKREVREREFLMNLLSRRREAYGFRKEDEGQRKAGLPGGEEGYPQNAAVLSEQLGSILDVGAPHGVHNHIQICAHGWCADGFSGLQRISGHVGQSLGGAKALSNLFQLQ